jgi:hypothetical protein
MSRNFFSICGELISNFFETLESWKVSYSIGKNTRKEIISVILGRKDILQEFIAFDLMDE